MPSCLLAPFLFMPAASHESWCPESRAPCHVPFRLFFRSFFCFFVWLHLLLLSATSDRLLTGLIVSTRLRQQAQLVTFSPCSQAEKRRAFDLQMSRLDWDKIRCLLCRLGVCVSCRLCRCRRRTQSAPHSNLSSGRTSFVCIFCVTQW